METIMKWWTKLKMWYNNRKIEKEIQKEYEKKLKTIKKKDPYTYD